MGIIQSLIKGGAVPSAPTIGLAETLTASTVRVAFSPPASGAPILDYTVTANPSGITATAAGSPITVSGLTSRVEQNFSVTARNAAGNGLPSGFSNIVSPTNVVVADRSVSLSGVGSGIQLARDGSANVVQNGAAGALISGEWSASGTSTTLGDYYEARMTVISGTVAGWSLAAGTWFVIGGNRLFGLSTTGSFTIEIRSIGAASALDSATITIT